MKRVLLVVPFNSIHIERWFGFFKNVTGIEVHLLIYNELLKRKKIPRWLFPVGYYLINKEIKRIKPDIINIHTVFFPNYLIHYPKAKMIVTPWNGDIIWKKISGEFKFLRKVPSVAKFLKTYWIKKTLNSADLITFNSSLMEEEARKYLTKNVPMKFIQVPGVDTKYWIKVEDKKGVRQKLGLPQESFIILSMRSWDEIYNISTIIEAAEKCQNENICFVFIAHSSIKPDKLFKSILHKKNCFILGNVGRDNVLLYYQSADIGISISSFDSCPQSVLEGMSCELPMIVGDIKATELLITDQQEGFIVNRKDSTQLLALINKLYDNREILEGITKSARAKMIVDNDYQVNMQKVLLIYKQLM